MKRPSVLPVCLLNNPTLPLPPAVEWTYGGEPVGVCLHASARFASVIAAWLAFFASVRSAVERRTFPPRASGNVPKGRCFVFVLIIYDLFRLLFPEVIGSVFAYSEGCM